eukprot:scaffold29080_cov23-Tisochrysis_lutea.AAC.1
MTAWFNTKHESCNYVEAWSGHMTAVLRTTSQLSSTMCKDKLSTLQKSQHMSKVISKMCMKAIGVHSTKA